MDVFLFRHGIAIDRDDPMCPADAERELTERGRRRTRAAARGLLELGVCPDVVFTSPYARAVQTAEILLAELRAPGIELVKTKVLLPEARPAALRKLLGSVSADSVLCVGHSPQLERYMADVLRAPQPIAWLKKAGVAHLSHDEQGQPLLVSLYEPRVLRRLAD